MKSVKTGPLWKLLCFAMAMVLMLTACASPLSEKSAGATEAELPEAAPVPESPVPEETVQEEPETESEYIGKILISELMVKNKASLMLSDCSFPDWIELYNASGEDISLGGWHISDRAGKDGCLLPDISLEPGAYFLILADGRDCMDSDGFHASFSLSEDDTVVLYDENGRSVASAACEGAVADRSFVLAEDGSYSLSACITPGYSNDPEGLESYQSTLAAEGPLEIYEVVVYSTRTISAGNVGSCDWVELKNISGERITLSDYWLSDDADELFKYRLPKLELAPDRTILIACAPVNEAPKSAYCSGFSLDSEEERLYLSSESEIIDRAFLHGIPCEGSFGRMDGLNGWFYFAESSPTRNNSGGFRRVTQAPVSLYEDGVFENVESVPVGFEADGKIYFTMDGSMPTERSREYVEPFTVSETCVIRAVSVENGAITGRPLTLNYIINESLSLPVVSVCADNPDAFRGMYLSGRKLLELPGSISFYEDDGSFTIDCGLVMSGDTSLALPKKSFSAKFRGAYGESLLNYDLFDSDVTEFSALTLRAGQDYMSSFFRSELLQTLCLQSSDSVISQHTRFVAVFVNGSFYGVYTLKERLNRQLYASIADVSKSSVSVIKGPDWSGDFYYDVWSYVVSHNMSDPECYEHFCSLVDIDSFIDWIILEGYSGNSDIRSGNIRYCRSDENDGKWRLMFYDLDCAFLHDFNAFYNIISPQAAETQQITQLIMPMLKNESFREQFLTRFAGLIRGPLSNENVLAIIDDYEAQLAPDLPRDLDHWGMSLSHWQKYVNSLREFIGTYDYSSYCIDTVCGLFKVTEEEKAALFG